MVIANFRKKKMGPKDFTNCRFLWEGILSNSATTTTISTIKTHVLSITASSARVKSYQTP